MDELVDALATFRLTRLIVDDVILDDVRSPLIDRLEQSGHRKLAYLLTCPWCISIWVGFGVLLVRRVPGWRTIARALAASAVTGLLAEK